MSPRCLSRRSSHVTWTTATHCCMASAMDYFNASSWRRMLPPAWSQAPVVVTTSHQCYGSYRGCQSISELCSRYISRSLERLPSTLLTTVAFCRTLVVVHCGPIPMTRGNCSCREHIINSTVLVPHSSTMERPSTRTTAAGTLFQSLQTISENSSLWRLKSLVTLLNCGRCINNSAYLSVYLLTGSEAREMRWHAPVR